jgi:hypothetical protein
MKITKKQLKQIIKEELTAFEKLLAAREKDKKCEELDRRFWDANYDARGPDDQSMVVDVKSPEMIEIEAEMEALGCQKDWIS